MTIDTARRLFTPVRDIRGYGPSRREERSRPGPRHEWSSNTILDAMALQDTGRWSSSRARAAALGRCWPALLVLALGWVAWLNAPSACSLEESAWRDADAQLTRLMIRTHRAPVLTPAVEQQTFALQSAGAASELLRAKKVLESSLAELRMCRQHGGTEHGGTEHGGTEHGGTEHPVRPAGTF
jgi:hypothetical protein